MDYSDLDDEIAVYDLKTNTYVPENNTDYCYCPCNNGWQDF